MSELGTPHNEGAGFVAPSPAEAAAVPAAQVPGEFDHLFDPHYEYPDQGVAAAQTGLRSPAVPHYSSPEARQAALVHAEIANMATAKQHVEGGGTDFRNAPPQVVEKIQRQGSVR